LPETPKTTTDALLLLLDILHALRKGCPWDRVQTPMTIRNYLLEECFETVEAVSGGDPQKIAEELGDLLFMLLFMALLFEERGEFDLAEVMNRSGEKMVRRHPHVFGNGSARDAGEVKENWERLKMAEKARRTSVLDGISRTLPGLMRANRVLSRLKRAKVPAEGAAKRPLWERVKELEERSAEPGASPGELGEIILGVAALAVDYGVNPETALLDSLARLERAARKAEKG
jgi:MazG family protein